MTSAHILYIPTIFLLGFLAGILFNGKSVKQTNNPTSTLFGKTVIGSLLIFLSVFAGTHFFPIPRSSKAVSLALKGAEIFDKKPSYNSNEVYARISRFPIDGAQLYQQFTYTIDVLFPATLLIFLRLLTRGILARNPIPKTIKVLAVTIPVIWFVSDMVENSVIYYLLDTFPIRHDIFAGALGYITIAKFALLFLSLLTPALIILLKNRLKPTD